ncbi:ABC transporter permease subunit [Alicyclobacillus ferrooxydans]|uniref:ABC transmembrane type-1 domain-containing protein n=1 Tax=Alicyclobacillus ferrooxydans TaxID=471514 RepID=A0A0P9GNT6_9BACL|nr:ABC transporter permease subunit [Alicyclobacillus ferrooxydans]KPV42179.1 hypothetical protein AN477_19275 [Alicyclobacillus ferrooxydans]
MLKFIWYHVKSWFYMVVLILAIASVGRQAQLIYVQGQPYTNLTNSWSSVFFAALNAPFKLLSPPYHPILAKMSSYIPLSLFFVVYAFIGSYVFGVLKGIADVFWRKRIGYRAFQGLFWLLDAVPMFGLIVLIETGSMFLAMAWQGDPIHVIPNQHFWLGNFLRANILMVPSMMYLSRITNIAISFELGEEYLLTARSKGIRVWKLFRRHLFRNIVPKLLNEAPTAFIMILSSLLALEYLSFQDKGFMFALLAGMGQGELGQPSLYLDQGAFLIQAVSGFLLMMALFTTVFQLLAAWLRWRWKVVHNYE